MEQRNPTRVCTGPVRLSYVHLLEPMVPSDGGEPRYSAALIIPKTDTKTLKDIRAAEDAAIQLGRSRFGWKENTQASLKRPLHDGDIERPDDENYAGAYYINASSRFAPQVVDRRLRQITDREEVYSGMYAKVTFELYPFSVNGNNGVGCGLGNVQKVRDGVPLSSRPSARDDFEALDDDEEEENGFLT